MILSVKVSMIIVLLLVVEAFGGYQPLQLQKPVKMYYQYGSMYLEYGVNRTAVADVLFCFVGTNQLQYEASDSGDANIAVCQLQDVDNLFTCIRLYSQNQIFKYDNLTMTIDANVLTADTNVQRQQVQSTQSVNNASPVSAGIGTNISMTLQSQLQTQILVIDGMFDEKQIYHMYTCPSYDKETSSCKQFWKQNYLHTFKHPEKKINLIVQRKAYCGKFMRNGQIITNHVFYGGTYRGNDYVMFMAALTFMADQSHTLNMWGGFSYSFDHANRDMFCYSTDGTAFDASSLIAGAIYRDIDSNIGGTENTEIVDNFYSSRYNRYYMYFIQYSRVYNTNDRIGDERLFRKIYDEFAFAAHFEQVKANQTFITTPTCLSSNYQHNFLMRFTADVTVFQCIFGGYVMTTLIFIFFHF